MTRQSRHVRTVILGQPVCTCGSDWVCVNSPEGRWNALREWLETAAAEARQSQVTLVPKATVLAGVVDHMDELEKDR